MSIKTPLYNLDKYENVYEPREDTFLLLDALEVDLSNIINSNPIFIAEVGSGSGIIVTALSSVLKTLCFATDINYEACLATVNNSELNNTHVEVINMNLLSTFKSNMFDLIVFNPPYVVTTSEEAVGNGLKRSWAGGVSGRQIIDNFLQALPQMLSSEGVCYMLVLKENNPTEIMNVVKNMYFKGYLKEKVYERELTTIEDIQQCIQTIIKEMGENFVIVTY